MNLIRQAAKDGVKKFILVTSIGTGDSKDAPPEQVYNVLKPVLEEKAKAEDLLKVWQHLSTVPTGTYLICNFGKCDRTHSFISL